MKKSTPSYMIYGELGIMPISIDAKRRIVSYWASLIENPQNDQNVKLSSKMYLLNYSLYMKNQLKSQWLDNLKSVLCTSGYSGIWYCQSFLNSKWLVKSFSQKVTDLFVQSWHADVNKTANASFYKTVKSNFHQMQFLPRLPIHLCRILLLFKTRNHRLPVEIGRWHSVSAHERVCPYCVDIGDEYHYLLICPTFTNERKMYIKRYYYTRPNTLKLSELFNSAIRKLES